MYRSRRHARRKSAVDYLMPFLIFVCIGVIAVLLFNLWNTLSGEVQTSGGQMHIENGSVKMRIWGTEDFFDLSSDAVVRSGDEIRTSADAQVIVELFDGTILRLDGGTDVIFEEIEEDGRNSMAKLDLVEGKLWVNKVFKDSAGAPIVVLLDSVMASSTGGTIFEVESFEDQIVRGISGEDLKVEIFDQEGDKVVETENVGIGQEIVFTDKVLQSYWQFKSPTVLSGHSPDFKTTSWYMWNIEEDRAPTQFEDTIILPGDDGALVAVPPEEIAEDNPEVEDEPATEEGAEEDEVVEDEITEDTEVEAETEDQPEISATLAAPQVVSVAAKSETDANGFYQTNSRVSTIYGTVSGATSVVVNNYTLQKFQPGDTEWSYFANADFGLLEAGENTYEVYALDADGNKSESIFVKVFYTPQPLEEVEEEAPAVEEEAPVVTEETTEEVTEEE